MPDQERESEDRKTSLLIPALAIGAAAGLLVGALIFRRVCSARPSPDEKAQRLLSSCESLLESIESGLADVRRSL